MGKEGVPGRGHVWAKVSLPSLGPALVGGWRTQRGVAPISLQRPRLSRGEPSWEDLESGNRDREGLHIISSRPRDARAPSHATQQSEAKEKPEPGPPGSTPVPPGFRQHPEGPCEGTQDTEGPVC